MLKRIGRVFKHRWLDASASRRAIPPDVARRLTERVAASERLHSGEIRICVEAGLPWSYLWRKASMQHITRQRALAMFGKLRVWDTANNNGVLIYLLLAERSIELVADRGLNDVVEPKTWQMMVSRMSGAFRDGQFDGGLMQVIDSVTALLIQHFPPQVAAVNPNELPDAPALN